MVELTGIFGGFGGILEALKNFMVIGIPLIAAGALFILIFFVLMNRKKFNYDVTILRGTETNLVQGYDKGGIIRLGSIRAFRLRKRKINLSVPGDKYIVVNEKGGLSIYLDKFSDEDYRPIDIRKQLEDVKKPSGEIEKEYISKLGVSEADSRNFFTQMTREIYNRHQQISKLEKFAPFVGYAVVGVVFIFMIIWYFKFGSQLADQGLECMKQVAPLAEACKQSLIPPTGGAI